MRLVLILPLLATSIAHADPVPTESSYTRPSYWDVFTRIPESLIYTGENAFTWDRSAHWTAVIASSLVTYYYDEEWLLEVQRWGREAGVGNKERTRTYIEAGEIDIFRGPSDTGSTLYFIGDGWVHFGLVAGFVAYGEMAESNRALATGLQMLHAMGISTLFNQIGKRSTGRESPNERSEKRGKWRPFPSFKAYGEKTSKYDAVPSGHVMTSTLTLTVMLNNYPEERYWLLPLGATGITLLALQMMNNGVHWASDYPLGIAMGVFFANMVKPYWRTDLKDHGKDDDDDEEPTSQWLPYTDGDVVGAQWVYRF